MIKKPKKVELTTLDALNRAGSYSDGANDMWDKWEVYCEQHIESMFDEIPSEKEIEKSPLPTDYARAYYQGKFDVLMKLQQTICGDK